MSKIKVIKYYGKWASKFSEDDLKELQGQIESTNDPCFAVKISGVDYDVDVDDTYYNIHQLFKTPEGKLATNPSYFAIAKKVV